MGDKLGEWIENRIIKDPEVRRILLTVALCFGAMVFLGLMTAIFGEKPKPEPKQEQVTASSVNKTSNTSVNKATNESKETVSKPTVTDSYEYKTSKGLVKEITLKGDVKGKDEEQIIKESLEAIDLELRANPKIDRVNLFYNDLNGVQMFNIGGLTREGFESFDFNEDNVPDVGDLQDKATSAAFTQMYYDQK